MENKTAWDIQIEKVNEIIKEQVNKGFPIGEVSDGFHSFNELYTHRIELYLALCRNTKYQVYKTKKNFEKQEWENWFLLCMDSPSGQISYHIPNIYWDEIDCDIEEYNFKYDQHNSEDILKRLKQL